MRELAVELASWVGAFLLVAAGLWAFGGKFIAWLGVMALCLVAAYGVRRSIDWLAERWRGAWQWDEWDR